MGFVRQEKRAQRLAFWVRRPLGGVGVFHGKGWWSKTSCSPSKLCLPWVSKRGIWDVPGILPGCPGPLGVFKKFVQKKFVRILRSLLWAFEDVFSVNEFLHAVATDRWIQKGSLFMHLLGSRNAVSVQGDSPKLHGEHGKIKIRSRPGKPNQRKGHNEKFMNFAHFCEFWCFSLGKQARFTLNFCSGMPLRKVHELTFLWFGLPG